LLSILLCAACAAKTPAVQITPQDLQLHKDAVVIDAHLRNHRGDDGDVSKLLGENLLRALAASEQ